MGNKRFLIWLAVILFFVIVVICWLPYLLTQFSILDFTETGQIGDTIGGTMSPFVGILAAILTFMAFWIQYQANEEQRASIADNKTEIQKQQKRYIIDRFEGKWLMLLDIYKETVKSLHYSNVTGKPVFKELLEELHLTYEMVEYGYTKWISSAFRHDKPEYKDSVMAFQTILMSDDRALRQFLTETAYTLFFYGKPYFSVEVTKNNPGKVIVMEQIYNVVSKIGFSKSENLSKTFDVHSISDGVATYRYRAPKSILIGESFQLAQYFRVLYSLAKYIDNADINGFEYSEKYECFKLLRCQMSDEEQALLYYNSISPMGAEWNAKKNNAPLSIDSMGLIAKYRLVKNLPPRFPFFGINPMEYYATETKYYEENGKQFFEHGSFYKYTPKVYVEKKKNGTEEEITTVMHFK